MPPRQAEYGSITITHAKDDESNEATSQGIHNGIDTTTTANKRKKYQTWVVLAAMAVAGLLLVLDHPYRHHVPAHHHHPAAAAKTTKHQSTIQGMDTTPVLSTTSPKELDLPGLDRSHTDAKPSSIWGHRKGPFPTNSWYLNLVSNKAAYQPDDSTSVYTVPYRVDTAAAATPLLEAGIRVHWPTLQAGARNIQMVNDFKNGMGLGCSQATCHGISSQYQVDQDLPLSHVGVSLAWSSSSNSTTESTNNPSMTTSIVRGMPYATMQYAGGVLPALYSYNGLAMPKTTNNKPSRNHNNNNNGPSVPIDGGSHSLECGTRSSSSKPSKTATVEKNVELHFINSDFTWGVFFSRPVRIRCDMSQGEDPKTRDFHLEVVELVQEDTTTADESPLTVRLALLDECTTGEGNIQAHCATKVERDLKQSLGDMLRKHALTFPTSPQLQFAYPTEHKNETTITIDWGAQSFGSGDDDDDLLMFALPHHQDQLDTKSVNITNACVQTFHGSTCLVQGKTWTLVEDMGRPMSFTAPRPPETDFIPSLAQALTEDIRYALSDNMMRGAADTYFSGKILARLARVLVIADEMAHLALGNTKTDAYNVSEDILSKAMHAAAAEVLPTHDDFQQALEQLKKGVQIWINGKAEAPYVFDKTWGGMVNCGCHYHGKGDKGVCNNTFPDCPALADVNEDFGNGYYNDHHYHYGYHVYAAAVVAKFDPECANEYFDRVLLYIRDFANPSSKDEYFVQFRHKDWFLGSSWASGIVSAENSPHGRNEESSSEAIAAYEAVTLYGSVMADIFKASSDTEKLATAKLIQNAGQLLTATELRATNRYWHVWSSDTHVNSYPAAYQQLVVGMLYDTMASFQTWFAPQAVVSYGIQLMPFTPVAEERDDPEWASQLYPLYKESCESAGKFCTDNGWSILQAGLCATAGDRKEAMDELLSIPAKVFDSLGGVGNSLANTIWYISTRKDFTPKHPLSHSNSTSSSSSSSSSSSGSSLSSSTSDSSGSSR